MLESFPITILVGTVLGFLAGLGVGGGSLFVLWLTLVIGLPHPQARVWNLIFFLPSAVISSFFRLKQKRLPIQKIWPAMVLGCVCAGIFSIISPYIHLELLKKCFGALLIVTGLREVFTRKR